MNQFMRATIAMCVFFSSPVSMADTGTDGILTQLNADDLTVVAAGELVYQAHCASCHGEQLEGQTNWRERGADGRLPAPPHDASGHTWHHADDLLFEITKYGAAIVINDSDYKSNMPSYESVLSDDDIIAVLSYIKNSWPQKERSWQEEVNASQTEGLFPIQKEPSLLDKLLK